MKKISQIATVFSGHSFRSSIEENSDGNCYVIQQKNVSRSSHVNWKTLVKTEASGRKEPNWLQQGDIIFSARGQYNFATYIDEQPPFPTVCSPHFFIIKVDEYKFEKEVYLAPFVAWQINQSLAQAYFDANASGTSMKAINLSVLKDLEIIHVDIEKQRKIIALNDAFLEERNKIHRFIDLREIEMNEIADQLLFENMQSEVKK